MKKTTLLLALICAVISTSAQSEQFNIKAYGESITNGYDFFVDNNEPYPISIKINFDLTNLKSKDKNGTVYVIPAHSKRQLTNSLAIINKVKAHKYSYKTSFNKGNHHKTSYDENHIYDLPFKKGEEYLLFQGYNGKQTHQNENSLDFTMPIGTSITAARGGIVTTVIVNNNKTCFKPECQEFNNKITIYHDDGTFADYAHLKFKGSTLKEGVVVKQGELIGYSGNVGYSDGPHLHFVVYRQEIQDRHTIKTKFKIDSDDTVLFLKEKESYKKGY